MHECEPHVELLCMCSLMIPSFWFKASILPVNPPPCTQHPSDDEPILFIFFFHLQKWWSSGKIDGKELHRHVLLDIESFQHKKLHSKLKSSSFSRQCSHLECMLVYQHCYVCEGSCTLDDKRRLSSEVTLHAKCLWSFLKDPARNLRNPFLMVVVLHVQEILKLIHAFNIVIQSEKV